MHTLYRTLSTLSLIFLANTALADPKLFLFDCGSIAMSDITAFGIKNEETDVRELFVPCYLIEQDGKRLLWDGGLPLGLVGAGPQTMESGAIVEYKQSIVDQLAAIGVTPADIDYTAYSHFHFDHVGAANAFTSSTLLINEAEFEAAFIHPEDNPIFDISLYGDLKDKPKVLLTDTYDVFGDGTVSIIEAPGHTPGHQVLLLNLTNTGPIMLSGDLYHFEISRRERRTPEFNTDKAQSLRSMDKIEALLQETGATLWIEHNKALADTLKKAPAFYD
jgi:N-acyl homoserine lactone hydrolase